MKVTLSLPDDLFDSAEALAKRLGVSRSRLYATALSEFVAKHRGRKLTDQLNSVYSQEEGRLESSASRLQRRSLQRNDW